MSENLNDLITCKLKSRDTHLIKLPRVLNCGHSYCSQCLYEDYLQNQSIFCAICKKNNYIDKIKDLTENVFINQIFRSFPKIYVDVLKRHKDAILDIKQVSFSKFEEFFEFQLEEIEIRAESLQMELDMLELGIMRSTDIMEQKLRKINHGFRLIVNFSNSRSAFSDREYAKCEALVKLGKTAHQYHNLFTADINSLEIFRFTEKYDITLKSFGNIKKTINLNTRRFKTARYRVHEYSNYLSSIGDICKLDDEHYVATNPVGDSLAVFEERTLKIVKTITNIQQTRFSYPMAICSNGSGNIYVCDCHNLRVLILNRELNAVQNIVTALYHPTDICFDSNHLYVLYSDRKSLHKLTSDGVLKTRFELKPTKLASHSEVDPIRISIQNTKAVVLYSNSKVFIHDIIENQKLVDNPKEIENNIMITGICYSSPFLLTIQDDGCCSFYDLVNQFNNEINTDKKNNEIEKYKCIQVEAFREFTRALPCFVTYFDESLFITFKNPNSHWLMKFDIK